MSSSLILISINRWSSERNANRTRRDKTLDGKQEGGVEACTLTDIRNGYATVFWAEEVIAVELTDIRKCDRNAVTAQ